MNDTVKLVFYYENTIKVELIKDVAIDPEDGSLLIFKPDILIQDGQLMLSLVYVKKLSESMDCEILNLPIGRATKIQLRTNKGHSTIYEA